MIDHQNWFRNVFVGMLGFMNDARILRISSLYHKAMNGELLRLNQGTKREIRPYILGHKMYPMVPWLMILHK
jgi:hypothetical protein